MLLLAILLSTRFVTLVGAPQVTSQGSVAVEEQRIHDIITKLPENSTLRKQLLSGVRGSGIHQPWMDDMRRQGVRRAVVWVKIDFNRRGRPKRMNVQQTELFTEYDDGVPISGSELTRLGALRQTLKDVALQRALDGAWMDVPHPRPKPFTGGAKIDFLDDELLPTLPGPLYCAGKSCLPKDTEEVSH